LDKFEIQGGAPLEGEIAVSGAKNSALPALAACLLTADLVTLDRIPPVRDIHTMEKLLEHAGARVTIEGERVTVEADAIQNAEAPYDLVKTMRASSLVLGPLVARCGRARVSVPGGCAIGARPINLHVAGLEQLGATVRQEHGYIEAEAPHGLEGAEVHFDRITVTGTEDLMMAAVLARGETVIHNAAREPEVVDLAALLTKMGANVSIGGPGTLVPEEFAELVESGLRIEKHFEDAIEGADVVMILRIQRERQDAAFFPSMREYAVHYGLQPRHLERAAPDAIVMHPGPMNRGVEISSEIADGSRSLILDQVTNGVAVRMAVLYLLAGGSPHETVEEKPPVKNKRRKVTSE